MSATFTITNAKVITRDAVVEGSISVENGLIASVDDGGSGAADAQNFDGDYLLPGLIEIHTDNVEKHFAPRPTVVWPEAMAAVASHDNQIAGSGITTVLNALGVGDYKGRKARFHALKATFEILRDAEKCKLLRADHLFHLRCEVSDPNLIEMVTPFFDETIVRLVSITDHTPGERQWRDLKTFRKYHSNYEWSLKDEDFDAFIGERRKIQSQCAAKNRQSISDMCKQRGIVIASHDDTTPEHVALGIKEGVTLSEFPCTMEAARLAHDHDLKIIAGAPNVVRGGSLVGNASALDFAAEGLLDILSSDYMPVSLAHAPFILHEKLGVPLPDAVAKVSCNVADALGFKDRGEIVSGKRADFVRVTLADGVPIVRAVWRQGRRVS
jgi:alpha-D-ribose 1-methylphosphonate 5-triphosphate diphosphatase